MQYGINLNSILPVRAEASERSEMVTQLLFGEYCEVIEQVDSFTKIKNHIDNYIGWVDQKMITNILPSDYERLSNQPIFRTCVPMADTFCMTDKSIYRLSAGSLLPFYNHDNSSFTIADKTFQIHPSFVSYLPTTSKDNIIATAMLFLNTPYLWGGKSMLGIDCSGFVQTVYSICGFNITRDASTQVKEGIHIESLDEALASDLLFFEKENKITHVGIYLGENKLIHASGKVKIETIDSKGIFNEMLNKHTHSLSTIRRI